MALTLQFCRNHSERPGIGVCPKCKATVCEECSTRVEGILHCKVCYHNLVVADSDSSKWRSASAVAPSIIILPLAYGAVTLMLYLVALAVSGLNDLASSLENLTNW